MMTQASNSQQRILIGRIGPVVLFICFLLDFSLRFLPPRLFTFRAWEAMTLFATGNEPFLASTVYRNPKSSGDLANLANLPDLRQFREEVFSTDAAGYRNPRETPKPFTGILLVGDSFTAGSGVSDELTLSEQLIRASGLGVYNGGETSDPFGLMQSLGMNRGLVIWQMSERHPVPLSTGPPERTWKGRFTHRILGDERAEALSRMHEYELEFLSYSPLQILFGRAVRLLQNDKILPNPYRGQTVQAKLRNGRGILFLKSEVENYDVDRPVDSAGLSQFNMQLRKKESGYSYCLFQTNTSSIMICFCRPTHERSVVSFSISSKSALLRRTSRY